MKADEILEFIINLESSYPVDQWVIEGIKIWPLLRIRIYWELFSKYYKSKSIGERNVNIKKLIRLLQIFGGFVKYYYAITNDHKKNHRLLNKKIDVIFLSDGFSFTLINNSWYEKYCNPFIDFFNKHGIRTFLITPQREYFIPRHSPSLFIQPHIDIIQIKNELRSKIKYSAEYNLLYFPDFLRFMRSMNFGFIIPRIDKVQRDVSLILRLSELYLKILKRTKPCLAFVVNYYNYEGMALTYACQRLMIKSIDIQHGFFNKTHAAYYEWNKVPEEGYELLPSLFWCWSQYEADLMYKWCKNVSKYHKPIVGGNLFLQLWQSNCNITQNYDQKIKKRKSESQKDIHILYTFNNVHDDEKYNLLKLLKKLKQVDLSIQFWLRLHPCHLNHLNSIRYLYEKNNINNVEIVAATRYPLYALLRNIDIHMTEYSSTVVEAKEFRVPSIVIHELGLVIFKELVDSGWVRPAFTSDEIISAIKMYIENLAQPKALTAVHKISSKTALDDLLAYIKNSRTN